MTHLLHRPARLRGRLTALLAAGLAVSTIATIAAVAVPAGTSSAQSAVPTASITVEVQDQGTVLDNYYVAEAAAFDKANPGDSVTMNVVPTNNVYKQKLLLELQGQNPPALFMTWGGGIFAQYITAKIVQPFGEAGMNDAGHPAWESDFLTSTLGSCEYSGVDYCIPFAGTQPVFFWYSKPLLAKYNLTWPKTLTALLADVKKLASHNVTTLVLGNNGEWEGLMYLEYFTDRYGGPQALLNVQENKPGAWSNGAFTKALEAIQLLVKDNAFEQGYSTINWGTGFTDALIYKNVALAELMGSWQIGFFTSVAPGWVKSGQLGIGAFPTVPGGKGNPTDLEGNTTTYVGLASHITAAQTYVAEQFAQYAWDSPVYATEQIAQGIVPSLSVSPTAFNSQPALKQYLVTIDSAVSKAAYFQYSWDQALGATKAQPMLDNLAKVFELVMTPKQFESAMNKLQ